MLLTLIRRFLAWDRDRTAIRILRDMDDRQLDDMGLLREDIEERVRGYRKEPQAQTKRQHASAPANALC